jgi:hypothetical protein
MKSKITERGWAGHFICSYRCLFRRNTLIEHEDIKIVVSTVGLMLNHDKDRFDNPKYEQIGYERYYETMVFHSNANDLRYHDADVSKEISFESPWSINKIDADDEANAMHDNVVKEIISRLKKGDKFKTEQEGA